MIRSFGNKATEDFFHGRRSTHARKIPSTSGASALPKLDILNAATMIEDLRSPTGNRLERLSGDLRKYHSIRINQQWRLVFVWNEGGVEEVEIIDYHE